MGVATSSKTDTLTPEHGSILSYHSLCNPLPLFSQCMKQLVQCHRGVDLTSDTREVRLLWTRIKGLLPVELMATHTITCPPPWDGATCTQLPASTDIHVAFYILDASIMKVFVIEPHGAPYPLSLLVGITQSFRC